ncbi:MAG: HD domain-containing protein [Candidatus Uhrbacteria bacterium]
MMYTPALEKAIVHVLALHQGATRKGNGTPYVIHPLAVMLILLQYTHDEDTLIAALYHDTIEDVEEFLAGHLLSCTNEHVVQIVLDVTADKDANDTRQDKIDKWYQRKRDYMDHLRDRACLEAVAVSCADKIHNMISMITGYQTYGEPFWARFNASRTNFYWYYTTICEIFQQRLVGQYPGLLSEFDQVLLELSPLLMDSDSMDLDATDSELSLA